MGPKRKKSKPNPEDVVADAGSGKQPDTAAQRGDDTESGNPTATTSNDTSVKSPPAPARTSWYGSFRSKASPATAQTSRESISVAQGATSESSTQTPTTPNSVSKSKRGSSRKSIPLAAEATRVHATSDASSQSRPRFPSEEKLKGIDGAQEEGKEVVMEEAALPPEPAIPGAKDVAAARSSWFGWWSRPDGYGSDSEKQRSKKQKLDTAGEVASSTPLPGTPTGEPNSNAVEAAMGTRGLDEAKTDDKTQMESKPAQPPSRSWFGLWSSAQNQQAAVVEGDSSTEAPSKPPEIQISTEPSSVEEASKDSSNASKPSDKKEGPEQQPQKSSGWAFWQSDKPKDPAPTPGGTQKQVGELAVADTPSQSHPEAAQFNEQRQESESKLEPKRVSSLLGSRKNRTKQQSSGPTASLSPADSSAQPTPDISQVPSPAETPPQQSDTETSKPTRTAKAERSRTQPNLILPSFRSTFPPAPNPGYVERLTQYLAQSLHIPGSQPEPPPQHIFISPSPPKIKKAVALGVHGFFPAPLLQKVLGQPTGTSIRFANYAATAIKTWCAEHQAEIKDVEIEKVALEGEGYIADRVSTLWKLLLNWLSHLRSADFILVGCHSQGVPVAVMLVAKLIQLGCLSPNARVGICAMAGINLGPFLEYKSRFFGGAALELFDFCDSGSKVSHAYAESMEVCLRHGVRITFVGSLDDQLVSLESSLHAPLSHPYVARAVFVDGRIHAPNFLTHLVVFALKLRNIGLSDHGLLRELSAPLAGSLVGGEGHSRVYDEPEVYKMAVEFALESTNVDPSSQPTEKSQHVSRKSVDETRKTGHTPLPVSPALANSIRRGSLSASAASIPGIAPTISGYEPPPSSASANPFYLPWAVRGMLEEPLVKQDMHSEVETLVREFEAWKPTSKVLKDVRFRLEGVRSML